MSSKCLVSILILLSAACFVPNWILSFPRVQQEIRDQTSLAVDANVTLGSAGWSWFPLPHVFFEDFRASRKDFILNTSVFEVYPAWMELVTGGFGIDGIALQDPDFLLRGIPGQEEEAKPPINWIRVTNGTFRMSKSLHLDFLPLKDKRPCLKSIYGMIEISGQKFQGKVSGKSSFASHASVEFFYDLRSLRFSSDIKLEHLDIERLYYKDVTTLSQFPAKGFLDVRLSAAGRAGEYLQGSLEAYSECLISKNVRDESIFSCGTLKLGFNYRPDDLKVHIKQLDFARPGMKLKGKVELFGSGKEARLLVDMDGQDVDLKQVRKSVLSMFGKVKEVKEVCDIVRGGKAKTISFFFDNKLTKLDSLHDMLIKGEVEGVPVYVPDQDLFLDSVSASMEIRKSVLYLKDATVKLRNSIGTGGSFVFGVSDDTHDLELDVQLDADLRDVKWALKKFVHDEVLHQELDLISKIDGRIRGRLQMGDDQRDFDTKVDVDSVRGALFYKRLNWPVTIAGGKVAYQNKSLSWQGLCGSAGRHRIDILSGQFSWKKTDLLRIDSFSGTIDAKAFLDLWRHFPDLMEVRMQMALDVQGDIRVEKFHGRAFLNDIKRATYSTVLKPAGLEIMAKGLPGRLLVRQGRFFLDNRSFSSKKCRLGLAGREIIASIDLKHKIFQKWKGRLGLSGLVNQKIAAWVRRHNWLPEKYFPRIPVLLDKLTIELGAKDHYKVRGGLFWKRNRISTWVDMDIRPKQIDVNKIRIQAPKEKASLRLAIHQGAKKRFLLAWQGRLSGQTLDRCLMNNSLLKGRLSGNFFLDYTAGKGRGFKEVKADLRAEGLIWSWGINRPLLMKALKLKVEKNIVDFDTDLQLFDDVISARGDLTLLGNRIVVYGDLNGTRLSDASLKYLIHGESSTKAVKAPSPESRDGLAWDIDVSGQISFAFKEVDLDLSSRLEIDRENKKPTIVAVKTVDGFVTFALGQFRDISIFGKSFCGLNVRASVAFDDQGGQHRKLILKTPKDEMISFEDFLECMHFEQKVLKGPFSAELKLTSPDGVPQSKGTLVLEAKRGNIKKFGIFSRILSVVNIVDLFSSQPGAGLVEGGLPYESILVKSKINKGVIHLEQAVINGRGLNLYGTGDVDLRDQQLNLIVFVAPLKTVDKIITSVPIIGAIIGGKNKSLISVPVKVSGSWDDPEVKTMPAKAVTDVFKKLLFNVIKAPFSIISKMGSEPAQASQEK
ncbi:MAG: hypothetical protein DSZ23_02670 [Thermodesulfatator sp.]|nr:MAG: hypothetical protein DSZ23_02670 [Thermodesulfatator sp.]